MKTLVIWLVLAGSAAAQDVRAHDAQPGGGTPGVPITPLYPAIPGVRAVVVSPTVVRLEWQAPDDPAGTYEYDLACWPDGTGPIDFGYFNQVRSWSNASGVPWDTCGQDLIFWDDPHSPGAPESLYLAVVPGVRYWFAILAYNTSDRINGYSGDITFQTAEPVPPPPDPVVVDPSPSERDSTSSGCGASASGLGLLIPALIVAVLRRRAR